MGSEDHSQRVRNAKSKEGKDTGNGQGFEEHLVRPFDRRLAGYDGIARLEDRISDSPILNFRDIKLCRHGLPASFSHHERGLIELSLNPPAFATICKRVVSPVSG